MVCRKNDIQDYSKHKLSKQSKLYLCYTIVFRGNRQILYQFRITYHGLTIVAVDFHFAQC